MATLKHTMKAFGLSALFTGMFCVGWLVIYGPVDTRVVVVGWSILFMVILSAYLATLMDFKAQSIGARVLYSVSRSALITVGAVFLYVVLASVIPSGYWVRHYMPSAVLRVPYYRIA